MDELKLADFYALFGDPPVLNLCNEEDHHFQLHRHDENMLTLECCILMPDGSHRTIGLPMTTEQFLQMRSAVEQRFKTLGLE